MPAGPHAPDPSSIHLGVVVLAAGASTRMGQPKLLLPWGTKSVLEHILGVWLELGAEQIAVVFAAEDKKIPVELDRVGHSRPDRVLNLNPERGMFSSIQAAAQWNGWRPSLTHCAIALGDQPQLAPATLRALLAWAATHPECVCQPSRNGRGRHPVIIPRDLWTQLAQSRAEHLKQFLQTVDSDRLARCELDDPGLDVDLDTPEDYASAVRRFLSPRSSSLA